MKANKQKLQERKDRSVARAKRKLDDAAAPPKKAVPRGRRPGPKTVVAQMAVEEELPEVPGVPEAEVAVEAERPLLPCSRKDLLKKKKLFCCCNSASPGSC